MDLHELALRQVLTSYWLSQMVYVAAKLGIADLLAQGPKTAAELATATGSHAQSLYRVLRALAGFEIFAEDELGQFVLTPMAEPLRTDYPHSARGAAMMVGEEHFRAWGELLYSVQTGGCAFEHVYGKNLFEYLAEHPEKGKIFDAAMTGVHGLESAAMCDAYDFSAFNHVIDVGGGNGSTLATILQRHPRLHGTLFDLPAVVERAKPRFHQAGLADRVTLLGGSFFESVPSGADAYVLRHIIHDWDDQRSKRILDACRAAIPQQGRLLVVESVIARGNEPSFGKLLDVNMLVVPGGMERTEEEYRDLFTLSGFELSRIVPTTEEVAVIEGLPR
ncbi:MAG TPA: methyltransferase [Pirellulales bacterium]|jgi:hypothetical protein|nr:methyltransferase [Pirellulales bacterium]